MEHGGRRHLNTNIQHKYTRTHHDNIIPHTSAHHIAWYENKDPVGLLFQFVFRMIR